MVSIVVPYSKDRGFLNEALESIDRQTYKDYEILIEHSPNSVGFNLNKGIKKAKGEFLIYLCDDDILPMNSLKDRVEAMEGFDFIHSRGIKFGAENKVYGLTNPYAQFNSVLENNGIMGGSTMYRTEILKQNNFREDLNTAEEWELHLRLLHKGYKLGFLDKICYHYRIHPQQKSIGNRSPEYQAKRNEVKQWIRSLYTPQQ